MDVEHQPIELREVAEFEAREEAEKMEEDPREHARRVLLQAHHEEQIQSLTRENQELRKGLEDGRKKLSVTRTRVTKAIEDQNRRILWLLVLNVLFLFGGTPAGQQFAGIILQALSKGLVK